MDAMMTARQVRQTCGPVTDMTLWRWLRDESTGFPKPVYVNRRRYWRAAEVAAWWASRSKDAPPAPQRADQAA